MDEEAFSLLVEKLEGIEYAVFSGLAVKIYSDFERETGDIDLLVSEKDIDRLADRLDAEVEDRDFWKDGNHITDRAFETYLEGLEVEASSGFPDRRVEEGTIDKVLERSQRERFMGESIQVEPVEELLVHKVKLGRDKDMADLEKLSDSGIEVERDFLIELADDWGLERSSVIGKLREKGFDI